MNQINYKEETAKLVRHSKYWRALETIPGILTYIFFLLPIIGSIYFPYATASLILVFTLFWLFRSIKLSTQMLITFNAAMKAKRTDWQKKLDQIEHPDTCKDPEVLKAINSIKEHNQYQKPSTIYQAILFVTYKESLEVVEASIKSYAESLHNPQKIILVFGAEDSDRKNAQKIFDQIEEKYGTKFKKCLLTFHPSNIPGEIRGKSANATYAARKLEEYLIDQKIDFANVILSNFDADTLVNKQYFNELTYKYLTTLDRTKKTYQPTHFFHNNIWQVPFFTRLVALSCSFWKMAESREKDKYKSFSSRSMSFKLAYDSDYWDPAVIPEDSRQYWTAYFIYDGEHELIPIYTPVYMDAVLSDTLWQTFTSQYKQLRRWAWGVCDFPFVCINLARHPKIDPITKIRRIGQMVFDSLFWSTAPILLTFTGFLPSSINSEFRNTVLAYNLPQLMSNLLTFSSVGILISAVLSIKTIPRPPKLSLIRYLIICIEWLFVPLISIILSSLPAIDAQTRLMFNKRLEYQVTKKARK